MHVHVHLQQKMRNNTYVCHLMWSSFLMIINEDFCNLFKIWRRLTIYSSCNKNFQFSWKHHLLTRCISNVDRGWYGIWEIFTTFSVRLSRKLSVFFFFGIVSSVMIYDRIMILLVYKLNGLCILFRVIEEKFLILHVPHNSLICSHVTL